MTMLQRHRNAKFHSQHGLCFYCDRQMWLTDRRAFARAQVLTFRESFWFRCTAEHLQARSDGGPDTPQNIVAACRGCNEGRHHSTPAPTPEQYRLQGGSRRTISVYEGSEVMPVPYAQGSVQRCVQTRKQE